MCGFVALCSFQGIDSAGHLRKVLRAGGEAPKPAQIVRVGRTGLRVRVGRPLDKIRGPKQRRPGLLIGNCTKFVDGGQTAVRRVAKFMPLLFWLRSLVRPA